MSLLSGIETLLHLKQPQQQAKTGGSAGQAIAQAVKGTPPDITYNPNALTNIPYSTHSAAQAQAMAQPPQLQAVQANPQSVQGQDVGSGFVQQPQEQAIQGVQNPGFTPLQNSGQGGQGYVANLQPAANPQLDLLRRLLGH